MAIKSSSLFLAVSLFALPAVSALAQSNTPSSNNGSNSGSPAAVPADKNPNVAGATGDAKVVGDPSTIAGDRAATKDEKLGSE
jgi:hypothetical protein